MAWTPPKKSTWIISFILMILGLVLIIDLNWLPMGLYELLPALTFFEPTLGSFEVWFIIALFLMFFAWFLMVLAVRVKGL